MNELEFIKNLAASAGRPALPSLNVAGSVLVDIANRRPRGEWVFPVVAAVSVVAAAVICLMALHGYEPANPLSDVVTSLTSVSL